MSFPEFPRPKELEIYTIEYKMRIIMSNFRKVPRTEWQPRPLHLQAGAGEWPHAADLYVGRQVTAVRLQSDVTQAELARAVGVSPQQLQKYENGKNRISASMLFEIATFLGVPVGRFFQGLPGNATQKGELAALPVDERITFLASSEGRRLIEGVMRLHPRTRRRVSALIAALGEELSALKGDEGCQRPKTENGHGGAPDPQRAFQTVLASDDAERSRA